MSLRVQKKIKKREYIHSAAVKVLKLKNKLVNIPRNFIMFRLRNKEIKIQKEPITLDEILNLGGLLLPPVNTHAFPFFYNSDDPFLFKKEFDRVISSTKIFQRKNFKRISRLVFENFHSCFDCNFTSVNKYTSPFKIVFVIEIYRTLVHLDLPKIKAGIKFVEVDVGLRERVENDLRMKQDKAFSEHDLQHIFWSLCLAQEEGYQLVSAETDADRKDGLSQVMAAIRMFKFDKEDDPDDADNQCAICWEQFSKDQLIAKMPCSHLFHKRCAFMWLVNGHSSCPLCRSACKTSIFS